MDYDFSSLQAWDEDDTTATNEDAQLLDVAKHIGSFDYQYKDEQYGTPGDHLGPIAQDLQRVQGLASTVHTDENTGALTVDSQYVALAALSLVAALARKVLGVEYEPEVTPEVSQPVQQPTVSTGTAEPAEQTIQNY